MDHLGGAPPVGAAAFSVQFAMARELLKSGVGIILEGPFFVDQTALVDVAALGQAAILLLDCPIELLERRYIERLDRRHSLHGGLEALRDMRERVRKGAYRPPELGGPLLAVDTSDGLKPSEKEIVGWLHEQIGIEARS
jgi:hypothetical protein